MLLLNTWRYQFTTYRVIVTSKWFSHRQRNRIFSVIPGKHHLGLACHLYTCRTEGSIAKLNQHVLSAHGLVPSTVDCHGATPSWLRRVSAFLREADTSVSRISDHTYSSCQDLCGQAHHSLASHQYRYIHCFLLRGNVLGLYMITYWGHCGSQGKGSSLLVFPFYCWHHIRFEIHVVCENFMETMYTDIYMTSANSETQITDNVSLC